VKSVQVQSPSTCAPFVTDHSAITCHRPGGARRVVLVSILRSGFTPCPALGSQSKELNCFKELTSWYHFSVVKCN
jgi:hypothetical protein